MKAPPSIATHQERLRMVRKMAGAALDCLEEDEYNSLCEWAEINLACDVRYVLEDGMKLAIAFDGGIL